jgi:Ni,Fe-hydrogenase I small subunit
MDLLKAWVRASVLLISREKIYEPANIVNGTSSPKLLAMAMAMAVLPVPGCPPISTALPAILPYLIISRMIPAALLASTWIR